MKMAKKIFLLVFVSLMSLLAAAQNGVGDWRLHVPFVGTNVKSVVETRLYVYYLAGDNLFRLDKETNENESLSVINDLSDMTISQIYYNKVKDYLVVVYSNSNIDVIKSNGEVVNMPEIKDAVMTAGKKINDVTFGPGLIYLATSRSLICMANPWYRWLRWVTTCCCPLPTNSIMVLPTSTMSSCHRSILPPIARSTAVYGPSMTKPSSA